MTGSIVVVVDAPDNVVSRGSLQALHVAHAWASARHMDVVAIAVAREADAVRPYATTVHAVPDDTAGHDAWVATITHVATSTGAAGVVATSSRFAQAVAPRIAVRLGAAYLEDVTLLEADADVVRAERPAQLQRVRESLETTASIVVATVRPGSVPLAQPLGIAGEIVVTTGVADAFGTRVRRVPTGPGRDARTVSLDDAAIVVTGGRGVGSQQGFVATVEPLAAALGAAVGSTRAVVDAGWRPYDEQIGQTGASVAPDVYVALGVSGAVQHLSGMRGSRNVVAVDVDPDAPIFRHCDVGIVADLHDFVPALLAELDATDP